MSTCAFDPVQPDDVKTASEWKGDPLENGPDTLHSRPHVLQNRYYATGIRFCFSAL